MDIDSIMQRNYPFTMYGFFTTYPNEWKIELDPKSAGNKGNVAFKSADKMNILISWGPLEEAKKKYASADEFASEALKRIGASREMKKVELIQSTMLETNSHPANFTHVKMIRSQPGLLGFSKAKGEELEIRSAHIYCNDSNRYFVIYGMVEADKSSQQKEIFEEMIKSFKCHGTLQLVPES
jgi:hypothetical protein